MAPQQDETLEVLTTYASSVEAGFAQQILEEAGIPARLGSEAAATALSYVGTAVGGVRLLVSSAALEEAARVLSEHPGQDEDAFLAQGEAEGWWDDSEDEPEPETPVSELSAREPSPELKRAYRAAIFGLPFAPLGTPLYSLYLVARHRLFLPDRGGTNWRYYVAMLVNLIGLYVAKLAWTGGLY